MSRRETGATEIGPESADDKFSAVLSEQQRSWVREVAETLRQRHPQDEAELRPAQDATPDDRTAPAAGETS